MTDPRARPPAPLPPQLGDLLATYRRAQGIPPDAEERIWSVVGAKPAGINDDADDRAEARRGSRSRRITGWVGFSMAAAAVLALAWQLGGQRAQRRELGASPDVAVMQAEARAGSASGSAAKEATPTPAVAETPAVPTEPEPLSPAGPTPAAEAAASPARPRGAAPERGPETPPSPSDLGAERELVASAWRSLAHGDEAAALATAAEHRRRFPEGVLAPEREAVDVIARCRGGEVDGQPRAAAFHRAHPRSPLAGRVDEACGVSSTK